MPEKQIIVKEVPAGPGWYAYTKDFEEKYASSYGRTPEEARQNHVEWMEFKDDA